ncbi:MAG: discoidin domain-containing protein [Kiritimatiellaeota bacterium]|nr:discoidin domain-containing protein [Kiritimatiellota bacterium]
MKHLFIPLLMTGLAGVAHSAETPSQVPLSTLLKRDIPASASSTWPDPGFEADKAMDGDPATRWSAAGGTRSAWLKIDLGRPVRVGRAVIREVSSPHTRQFVVEFLDGQTWQPLAHGTTIGGTKVLDFETVTARRFRLNILAAADVPSIEEFRLYPPDTSGRAADAGQLAVPPIAPVFAPAGRDASLVAGSAILKGYVDRFNAAYLEKLVDAVSDADTCAFLEANIPLFDCPDQQGIPIEKAREIVLQRCDEGLFEDGVVDLICRASGGDVRDMMYLVREAILHSRPKPPVSMKGTLAALNAMSRGYSNWLTDAVYARYLVNYDQDFVTGQLDGLMANHAAYSKGDAGMSRSRLAAEVGLYWQCDSWDGMEHSIGGTGVRPTISSYMYGSAMAIARIAKLAGRGDVERKFQAEAEGLKQQIQQKLWDPEKKFYKVLRYKGAISDYTSPALEECPDGQLVKVRELIGYIPWYFNLPDDGKGYEEAWKQLSDPQGFQAPYGPSFAERRHPKFQINRGGCEWRGASWPYATSQTLTALANLLNNYQQKSVDKKEYFNTLRTYAASHYFTKPDGSKMAWIDESLDPDTGKWITNDSGFPETRGRYYNHSTFCDLIITGLVGLRPRADHTIEVNPLVPDGTWDWFKLENIAYHGKSLTILWDRTGKKYNKGTGFLVFADGKLIAQSAKLQRVAVPEATAR